MSCSYADQSAELFLEHYDRLHRFARQLAGTSADADDLVQQTFLKVHDYLRRGNTIRAPASFLFATLRNLVSDNHRQNNRRRSIEIADSVIGVDEVAPDSEELSVEQRAMSEREFEELCAAIARLPERMRHVFVLKRVYGHTCREIAEQLGTSPETVRKQAALAFKRLRARHPPGKNRNE